MLGPAFLGYVLSIETEAVVARVAEGEPLDDDLERALLDVIGHAQELVSDRPFGGVPEDRAEVVEDRLRRLGWVDLDRGHSHANLFRLATGGHLPALPEGMDALEEAVARAAMDYYPVTLLPLAP